MKSSTLRHVSAACLAVVSRPEHREGRGATTSQRRPRPSRKLVSMGGFWDFIAWMFWIFVFVAYLMVVFSIIGDLFRDDKLSGWLKAVWILFLIFVPFLTALVYLIA